MWKRRIPKPLRFQAHASLVVILSLILAGLTLWDRLPDEMAVHFSFSGQPDAYESRAFVVFGLPCILAAMQMICVFSIAGKSSPPAHVSAVLLWIVPAVAFVVSVLLYALALGAKLDVGMWAQILVGGILIAVGNVKSKNPMGLRFGRCIRVFSAEDRQKIARFSAYCLVLCGIAVCVCAASGDKRMFTAFLLVSIALPWTYVCLRFRSVRRSSGA